MTSFIGPKPSHVYKTDERPNDVIFECHIIPERSLKVCRSPKISPGIEIKWNKS